MTRRRFALSGMGILAVLALLGWATRGTGPNFPSTTVERGTFIDAVQVRGEIKAGRSITIIAPSDAGDLRITKLVRTGTQVKRGDVLIEFDASTVARTVDEKRSEVRGFEAEMEQVRFDSRTTEQESVKAESTAGYNLNVAKLDYSAKPILSRVEGEQRGLKVDDSEHKLHEASSKLSSDRVAGSAKLAGVTGKRGKSAVDLHKAEGQLHALTVTAPADGIVAVLRNWRSGNWMNPQDFKEGDRVWAGASIAELPDISSLFGSARVDEVERGRLAIGQPATVRVEALPDKELKAHVDTISALAKADFTSWPPPRNFDVRIALDDIDDRLRPGMTVSIRIATETLRQVLTVPAQAVFSHGGADVVYVLRRGGVERRVVAIDRRNADRVVLRSGVEPGERVTLVEPGPEVAP
jgi:RND family efflux transporter MFP subunit